MNLSWKTANGKNYSCENTSVRIFILDHNFLQFRLRPRKYFPERSTVWAILNELVLYVLTISLHSISFTFHKPLIFVALNFSFDRRVNLGHGYVYLLQFFMKFMKTWIKSESLLYIHGIKIQTHVIRRVS